MEDDEAATTIAKISASASATTIFFDIVLSRFVGGFFVLLLCDSLETLVNPQKAIFGFAQKTTALTTGTLSTSYQLQTAKELFDFIGTKKHNGLFLCVL